MTSPIFIASTPLSVLSGGACRRDTTAIWNRRGHRFTLRPEHAAYRACGCSTMSQSNWPTCDDCGSGGGEETPAGLRGSKFLGVVNLVRSDIRSTWGDETV